MAGTFVEIKDYTREMVKHEVPSGWLYQSRGWVKHCIRACNFVCLTPCTPNATLTWQLDRPAAWARGPHAPVRSGRVIGHI